MNRQVKRQMAKQGADRPRTPEQRRQSVNPQTERTTPRSYLREVQGEFKKVAWPPRAEIMNSTVIVVIGVVVLKDVYDLSHEAIADELGITVAAAKVRLHRGRRKLRDVLYDEGAEAHAV